MNLTIPNLTWQGQTYTAAQLLTLSLPLVEIFETIEGEGLRAGFPTIFVRVFHCNLRCRWCDTPYSYAPAQPEFEASLAEIIERVNRYSSRSICLTGGEPLIHRYKSAALIHTLAALDQIEEIHIETNGAIDLSPFAQVREHEAFWSEKVRFIMDYKLPESGEMERMVESNFDYLGDQDEIKFVIGSDQDFETALEVIQHHYQKGTILMSPVWERMPPRQLVEMVLSRGLAQVKISLQLHKLIWDPDQRGV